MFQNVDLQKYVLDKPEKKWSPDLRKFEEALSK